MTDQAKLLMDTVVTFGAGITALIIVFGILILFIFKVPRYMEEWKKQRETQDLNRSTQLELVAKLTAMTAEVIRSNTEAFRDAARATDNMSKALELLTSMYERTSLVLESHDRRSQTGWESVAKIEERTASCRRGGDR